MTTDLIFNSANSDRPQTVTICVIADYVLEDSEFFNVTLTTADSNAILVPNSATITIEDVDGKVISVALIIQHFNCSSPNIQGLQLDSTAQHSILWLKMLAVLVLL